MMTLFKGFFGFRKDLINKISVLSHNWTSLFRLILRQKKGIRLHAVGFTMKTLMPPQPRHSCERGNPVCPHQISGFRAFICWGGRRK